MKKGMGKRKPRQDMHGHDPQGQSFSTLSINFTLSYFLYQLQLSTFNLQFQPHVPTHDTVRALWFNTCGPHFPFPTDPHVISSFSYSESPAKFDRERPKIHPNHSNQILGIRFCHLCTPCRSTPKISEISLAWECHVWIFPNQVVSTHDLPSFQCCSAVGNTPPASSPLSSFLVYFWYSIEKFQVAQQIRELVAWSATTGNTVASKFSVTRQNTLGIMAYQYTTVSCTVTQYNIVKSTFCISDLLLCPFFFFCVTRNHLKNCDCHICKSPLLF